MSIFTLQKTYTSHTKSLSYTNFTILEVQKEVIHFIKFSASEELYNQNQYIILLIRIFSIDPKVGVTQGPCVGRHKHSLNHFSLSDRVGNKQYLEHLQNIKNSLISFQGFFKTTFSIERKRFMQVVIPKKQWCILGQNYIRRRICFFAPVSRDIISIFLTTSKIRQSRKQIMVSSILSKTNVGIILSTQNYSNARFLGDLRTP